MVAALVDLASATRAKKKHINTIEPAMIIMKNGTEPISTIRETPTMINTQITMNKSETKIISLFRRIEFSRADADGDGDRHIHDDMEKWLGNMGSKSRVSEKREGGIIIKIILLREQVVVGE